MNFKLSTYIIVSDEGYDETESTSFRIVFSTRTLEVFWLTTEYVDMLQAGNFDALPAEVFKALVFAEILVPEVEQELQLVTNRDQAAKADDKTLRCAVGIKHEPIDTIVAHLSPLLSSRKYRKLLVNWQEDDNTVSADIIALYTLKLKDLASQYGCSYEAGLATKDTTMLTMCKELGINTINIILQPGDISITNLAACIDAVKQSGMQEHVNFSIANIGIENTNETLATIEIDMYQHLLSQGMKPVLLPVRRSFRPLSGALAAQCTSCAMRPVCTGSIADEWQNGHVPCPAEKYNAGKKLMLNYQANG